MTHAGTEERKPLPAVPLRSVCTLLRDLSGSSIDSSHALQVNQNFVFLFIPSCLITISPYFAVRRPTLLLLFLLLLMLLLLLLLPLFSYDSCGAEDGKREEEEDGVGGVGAAGEREGEGAAAVVTAPTGRMGGSEEEAVARAE